MVKKIHFFIIFGILLVGFILGSFLDLQIDKALFVRDNTFGLIMASFAVYPCYAGLAFIGGGLLATTMKQKDLHIILKIISYGLAALAYVMAVYLCGREWPSTNGFNVPEMKPLSYGIAALIFAGVAFGAFVICRKGDSKNLWQALMVMAAIFVVGLLPAGYVIKAIIHRPRFRYLVYYEEIGFKNWWETVKNYKDYFGTEVGGFVIDKEEFKSFPSGHSGTAAIMMMFLPYASMFFTKLKGKETMLFYVGFAWTLLMGYSRLLVGAHYLTDICMGALIVMVAYFIGNEIGRHYKWIYQDELASKRIEEQVQQ